MNTKKINLNLQVGKVNQVIQEPQSEKTLWVRKECSGIVQIIKEKKKPMIIYPTMLSFLIKNAIKYLQYTQKVKGFTSTKSVLHLLFKDLLSESTNWK